MKVIIYILGIVVIAVLVRANELNSNKNLENQQNVSSTPHTINQIDTNNSFTNSQTNSTSAEDTLVQDRESQALVDKEINEIETMSKEIIDLNEEINILKKKIIQYENKDKAQVMELKMYKEKLEKVTNISNIEEKRDRDAKIRKLVAFAKTKSSINNGIPSVNYLNAYNLLINSNIDLAQAEFENFLGNPQDATGLGLTYASFYLGNIYFINKKYDDAIYNFSLAYKQSKDVEISIRMLLKMAEGFSILGKNTELCLTVRRLNNEYKPLANSNIFDSEDLKLFEELNTNNCEIKSRTSPENSSQAESENQETVEPILESPAEVSQN